jgi:hypothetical protein
MTPEEKIKAERMEAERIKREAEEEARKAGRELAEALRRRERRAQLVLTAWSLVAAIGGLAGAFFVSRDGSRAFFFRPDAAVTSRQLESVKQELAEVKTQLALDRAFLEKASAVGPEKVELAKVETDISALQSHVARLEDAIGQSPEKALSVPLLRKDIDNLKETTQAEVTRVYDQNKWFLGLVGTMALGVLGLAISNFLQLRKKDS